MAPANDEINTYSRFLPVTHTHACTLTGTYSLNFFLDNAEGMVLPQVEIATHQVRNVGRHIVLRVIGREFFDPVHCLS